MPSVVHLQLKGITKLHAVKDGFVVEKDPETSKVNIKDALGELIGSFDEASVLGWSLERTPVDLSNLSENDLKRVIAELEKCGTVEVKEDQKPEPTGSVSSIVP